MSKLTLVVDDSHVIRRITANLLRALNFEAVEAESAGAALAICAQRMPALVLLDWIMPSETKPPMTSLECIHALRRLPGGGEAVILYCSTEHDPAEFERAIRAGANDVIVKPFDRDMLSRKLIATGLLQTSRASVSA